MDRQRFGLDAYGIPDSLVLSKQCNPTKGTLFPGTIKINICIIIFLYIGKKATQQFKMENISDHARLHSLPRNSNDPSLVLRQPELMAGHRSEISLFIYTLGIDLGQYYSIALIKR